MRALILLFTEILKHMRLQEQKQHHMEEHIMATLQELQAAIADLQAKVAEDVAQVALLVTKVNELITRLNQTPGTPDFSAEIAAIQSAIGTLTSDNPAIQAALDASVPPPANP